MINAHEIDEFIEYLTDIYGEGVGHLIQPVRETVYYETNQLLTEAEVVDVLVTDLAEDILGFLHCILYGHTYEDDGGGNPESGAFSMHCTQCGAGFGGYMTG